VTRLRLAVLLAGACLLGAGCSVNPVSGRPELSLISTHEEAQLGKEADVEMGTHYGFLEDPELQRYVDGIVQRLAEVSHRPMPYRVRLIDDPMVNAFALPGGYVYVTRGMLAHLDNEAALAGTLGHEIAHVTARHSARDVSRRTVLGLPLNIVEWVLPAKLAGLLDGAVSPVSKLLYTAYGRGQEEEADELGAGYAAKLDYDVRETAGLFRVITMLEQLSGGSGQPWYYDSHPPSEERAQTITELADELQPEKDGLVIGRDRYLDAIDGLVIGLDPRDGVFDGLTGRFVHPRQGIGFPVPGGWHGNVQGQQAVFVDPSGQDMILIRKSIAKDLSEFERVASHTEGIELIAGPERLEIGGFQAVRASARVDLPGIRKTVSSTAFAVKDGVLVVIGLADEERFAALEAVAQEVADGAAPARTPNLHPARLRVVEAAWSGTFLELATRYPIPLLANLDIEGLAVLNGVTLETKLERGQRFKIVSAEPFPPAAGDGEAGGEER
jgi:predicted Zn-dependent protease